MKLFALNGSFNLNAKGKLSIKKAHSVATVCGYQNITTRNASIIAEMQKTAQKPVMEKLIVLDEVTK
jgi:hypothetical protein